MKYSEYTTFIPEYFFYNTHLKGYFSPKSAKTANGRTINFNQAQRNSSLDFLENIVKYSLENIPALKDEGFVNNIGNYQSKILHELSGTKYPQSPYKNYNTDWESVVKGIYESDSFGPELNKTGYFEKDLDTLLAGISSPDEKIGILFNYVQSRMNWNEFFSIYTDDGVKKAYQDKKGNIAEINLMLTAMLRYAGFEANPVLVSTRSNGISLFPSKSAYNSVIAGIELNNQVVLLDATNKFASPDILPIRDLNWFGRIIGKISGLANLFVASNKTT